MLNEGTSAADAIVESQSPGGAVATEAYLSDAVGAAHPPMVAADAGTQPPTADPPVKLANRFDSVEALESGYLESQKEMGRLHTATTGLKEQAALADQYKHVINLAETDPGFADHVMSYGGFQEDAPAAGDGVTRAEAKADARKEALEIQAQSDRKRNYEQQLAQECERTGKSRQEVEQVLGAFSRRQITIEDMVKFEEMDTHLATAQSAGRQEVVDKVRSVASKAPAIGATHGTTDAPRDIGDVMGDEIINIGGKSKFEQELLG